MSGGFHYVAEPRVTQINTGEVKLLYFVVEVERRHELAPWFEESYTAEEIAAKVSRGDEYCDRIPACPVGSPVPRPKDQVWVPTLKQPTLPQSTARRSR